MSRQQAVQLATSNPVTDFALLTKAYHSGKGRMWIVYRESGRVFGDYKRGEDSTSALAQKLAVSVESIRNWARAGWLRTSSRGLLYHDETGQRWTFYDLRRVLSLAHFQVAGRALQQELASPEDIFEWLGICATEQKSAGWLAAQVMPADSNQFMARVKRLLATALPDGLSESRRRAWAAWLKDGQELLG